MKLLGFAFVVMAPFVAASPSAIADTGVVHSVAVAESATGAAAPMQSTVAKPVEGDASTGTSSGLMKSARRPALRTVTRTANSLPGPFGRASGSGTPEPSSLLLLGFGLLGLAFVVFRKAKSSDVVAQE
jgi:hypothetical protein